MSKSTCTIEGCQRSRKYRLYCDMHQDRVRRTGSTDAPEKVKQSCKVDGCATPQRARGMCAKHYARWARHGTVEPVGKPRQKDLPCPVEGCTRNRWYGGYCHAHARRNARYGNPLGVAPPRPPVDEVALFWANVTPGEPFDCWPWRGSVAASGYGIYSVKGVQYKAHRFACSIGIGRKIDDDKMACHRCSNPICVNPSHLYEGDGLANAGDMVAAGNSQRGTKNFHNRLTPAQVQEVRGMLGGRTAREVADLYGVGPSSIRHIWRGTNWAWLPWPNADRDARRTRNR